MAKPIWNVSGSKGGIGKSITAMAAVHYLQEKGEKVLLVEADDTNPDVLKSYREEVETEALNLDNAEGWMDLANILEEKQDYVAVINTPARSTEGVNKYGEILAAALPELKRELLTLWVISHERDSLELLKKFMEAMRESTVHVLRNLYWAPAEKFTLYDGSNIRAAVEKRGGKTLDFPVLPLRLSTALRNDRMSIRKAIETSTIGNRIGVTKWVEKFSAAFDEVS